MLQIVWPLLRFRGVWVVYEMEGLNYETTFGMSLFHDVDCGVNAQPEGSPRSHFY